MARDVGRFAAFPDPPGWLDAARDHAKPPESDVRTGQGLRCPRAQPTLLCCAPRSPSRTLRLLTASEAPGYVCSAVGLQGECASFPLARRRVAAGGAPAERLGALQLALPCA